MQNERARRKRQQDAVFYTRSFPNLLQIPADVQHSSALSKITFYIISACRPISVSGSVRRGCHLVNSDEMCDERHIPLLKLREEEQTNLPRSQEVQPHPYTTVVQLEVAANTLRRPMS